jgi:ribosome biogenesis protein BRX1
VHGPPSSENHIIIFVCNDIIFSDCRSLPAMASVYKSISKNQRRNATNNSDDEDLSMDDLIGNGDNTSESEKEDDLAASNESHRNKTNDTSSSRFMPKTRILMLTSRGVTHR